MLTQQWLICNVLHCLEERQAVLHVHTVYNYYYSYTRIKAQLAIVVYMSFITLYTFHSQGL